MTNDDSSIEQLKKKLYSNSGDYVSTQNRARLPQHKVVVGNSWNDEVEGSGPVTMASEIPKKGSSFFKKLLILSLIILVIAIGFAGYIFYSGTNIVSNSNIDFNLVGPVSAPSGDVLSLDVDITNKNTADLVLADLVVTYPEGTRNADDKVTPMTSSRIDIGTIKSGETVRQTIKSVLFGQENAKENIQVSLEYRIIGSDTIFVKDQTYPIYIGTAPITVSVTGDKQVIPEQETDFHIHVQSNSSSIVKGVILKAEYPFGFQYISSDPATSVGNDTWILGDIQPGESMDITLRGKILGDNSQTKVFNFLAGTQDPNDSTNIGTIFVTDSDDIALTQPFLSADIALNGASDPVFVASAGAPIKGEITYQNNLNVPLNDAEIDVTLTGTMLDRSSVNGEEAYYRSSDNTLVWDKTTLTDLAELDPGQSGHVQFSFAALAPSVANDSTFRKQSLSLSVNIHAKRLSENNVPEDIAANAARQINIQSDLALTTRLVRNVGPFQNTGPFPPMPDQPTTYTALVSVSNSYNTVKSVVYTATLPEYVKWLGVTYPDNNGVTYNPDTHQITWALGDIAPGTGYSSSPKEFAYQVSFLPSIGQESTTPDIVDDQKIAGIDDFAGDLVQTGDDPLTIKIDSDPDFQYGDDKVGGQ